MARLMVDCEATEWIGSVKKEKTLCVMSDDFCLNIMNWILLDAKRIIESWNTYQLIISKIKIMFPCSCKFIILLLVRKLSFVSKSAEFLQETDVCILYSVGCPVIFQPASKAYSIIHFPSRNQNIYVKHFTIETISYNSVKGLEIYKIQASLCYKIFIWFTSHNFLGGLVVLYLSSDEVWQRSSLEIIISSWDENGNPSIDKSCLRNMFFKSLILKYYSCS